MTAINRPGPEEDAQPGIGGDLAARLRLWRAATRRLRRRLRPPRPSVFGIVRRVVRDPAQVRPIAGNHCGDAGLKGTVYSRMEEMSFRSGAAVALGLFGIIIPRAPVELTMYA